MPRPKKNPITDPTGEKAAKKARGSQPAQTGKNSDEMRERIKARFQTIQEVAGNVGNAANAVGDTFQSVATGFGSIGNAAQNIGNAVGLGNESQSVSTRHQLKNHEVFGGLTLPQFHPGEHLATDLFTDSSPVPRTKKVDADKIVEAINERVETLRIVDANLGLNTAIIKAGTKSEKMMQAGIEFGTSKINTDTKLIQFNDAVVQNEIAFSKLNQSETRLEHEQITLHALRNETDQRRRYWQSKHQLGESRIKDVQLAVSKLDAKLGSIDVDASVIE